MHDIAELARQYEQAMNAAKIAADRVQTAATALAGARCDALLAELDARGIVPGVKVTTNEPGWKKGRVWGFVGVERNRYHVSAVTVEATLHKIKADGTIGKARSRGPISPGDLVLWTGDET